MVVPDKGSIRIDGQEVLNKFEYRNEIDYLPQIARFPGNLSVKELIKMINELRSKPSKSDELVKAFGLVKALDQKLGHLSGGTKQKVNLVLTFMFDSPLVILDEPTTGLDPISLIYLKDLIRQEKNNGKTILITSHIMSFVEEVSDEIVFLLDGKIYFKGSVANLKKETGQKDLEHAIATIIVDEHI